MKLGSRIRRYGVITVAGAVLLVGCSAQAVQDRGSGGGKNPDATKDATHVTVFLNADAVPNVALFCIDPGDGPIAILSTLSGGDNGVSKASSFTRMSELDVSYCGGNAR